MTPPYLQIVTTYPKRGPMQQFRLSESMAFHCFRCNQSKKSKLITVYDSKWGQKICNACYGRLLSIFDIKAGTASENTKAEELSKILLQLVTEEQLRTSSEKLLISSYRFKFLTKDSLRFIATSEFIAEKLSDNTLLEWSPAVIGLCKAVEVELIVRVFEPLRKLVQMQNLGGDVKDKDLARIAKYCNGSQPAPEIGSIRYFFQIAANSKVRSESSILLLAFKKLINNWPKSSWLLNEMGALDSLNNITTKFRNKAAHIESLTKDDYLNCRQLILENNGVLWELISATQSQKGLQII